MTPDLTLLGYHPGGTPGLWVRPDAPAFGYNDGDEHETWVARTIRGATDTSSRSRELEAGIRDWPSLYHLSHQRANLVRPLLGSLRGPVLEIGAGTGAITRALGEQGLEVVAVEGSPRRAAVCADRCRDLPNVQVVADTVQGFGQHTRFATVVLVGVLEYSRMFGFESDGRDPVDVMLEHVAGLVAPDGELVLAIENQLGLKYFAGFPEDHLGRRMVGVEDRYGPDTAVTFGRTELAERLRLAGLAEQDWYFPFPDYKLPTTVLSERAFDPAAGFDAGPLVVGTGHGDHQEPATTTFDPARAWQPVHRNRLVPDLANSFLVRAARRPRAGEPTLAWYFGNGARRPEFSKSTTFEALDDGIVVRRSRAVPDLADSVGPISIRLDDEPYRPGAPWTAALHEIVGLPGWTVDDLAGWFAVWFDALRARAGLAGDERDPGADVPGSLLDALPRNLLDHPDDRQFIDLEWVAHESIPLGYLVFRALYDSLASLRAVAPAEAADLTIRELVRGVASAVGVDLDDEALRAHWAREREFQSLVLGSEVAAEADAVLDVTLTVVRDLDAVVADAEGAPALRAEQEALREEIERRGAELDRLRGVEADLRAELGRVAGSESARLADLERSAAAQRQLGIALGRLERENELNRHEIDVARASAAALDAAAAEARGTVDALRAELAAHSRTLSWRVTVPLRAARRRAGSARRAVRRLRAGDPAGGAPAPEVAGPAAAPTSPTPDRSPDHPEDDFDVRYYRRRNDDLGHMSDDELRQHYHHHGRGEGRRGRSVLSEARISGGTLDPARETVLLLLHEATRTGAPVLGWNLVSALQQHADVVVVLMHGGELEADLARAADATVALVGAEPWHPQEALLLAEELVQRYSPTYAIANSAATHPVAPALERVGVPVVGLVHEFASSMRPNGVLAGFYASVSEVVFPAPIVAESMRGEYADLLARGHEVIAQGQSRLPAGEPEQMRPRVTPLGPDGVEADLPERTVDDFLADLDPGTLLVVGAGTLSPRKGVEFFVQAADHLRRAASSGTPVAFAWIGHRIEPLQWYVDELHEQVRRSGVADTVTFLGPTADLEPLYRRAGVFFLSSRLDPLPNVTIDAALAGVPVVAFAGASGFAEWLEEDQDLRSLVVPHLDAAAAADAIARMTDPDERRRYGERLRTAAGRAFDMVRYAEQIATLGHRARAAADRAAEDAAAVAASGAFSTELYAGPGREQDLAELVGEYVHRSRLTAPRARARTGLLVRRPTEGFHPLVYAEQHPDYREDRDGDPFADYLRRGRPEGPWQRQVLRPVRDLAPGPRDLRVLVHGHFHYPELVDDLVARLAMNRQPVDLRLTATSADGAAEIERRMTASGFAGWSVDIVPNRGRDLAPLLTGPVAAALADHDLVLHVHGKRSPHVSGDTADRWRTFLWENLVGGEEPMLDRICAAFADDPTLGLVSPEDPHLNDWDLNRGAGEKLARRLGLRTPLTTHFDFPLGAMFWARTRALAPLVGTGFAWEDYPAEPLPIDGTMLHALERVIPFVVQDGGFSYAKTAVPGVTR
ncbi:glycosyltransferase [Cellulomonas sp. ACRRI]|uniref:rhamnan synthesis F family protein n=1 Tax=Cellulomonas sp. ACRRI TaxID=2918188 RepID=UPI001EF34118|nr:rhamnan synthesis F family protein [Cellulomonas sp. ACRRI]MCG7285410.1 glycosyltransferase [Cellulomonas sp. ACRRI]